MNRWIGALAILALTATAGCGLLPKEVQDPPPALTPPVQSEKAVYTAHTGDITDEVVLRAVFAPARVEDLSWPGGGRVSAVYVKAGDTVKAGQVLAAIHTETLATQVAAAQVRYAKAQLSLEAGRYDAQFRSGTAADLPVRQLELDLELARIDLEGLQAQLAAGQLVAPFTGVVQAVNFKPGDNAGPYATAVTLADPSDLLIQADVDNTTLPRLAVGQAARLEFSELPAAGAGRVVELPDPHTATGGQLRIKVRTDGAPAGAHPGVTGKVHVILQQKTGVLLLANAALRQFNGRNYVLMQEPRREVDVVLGVAGETETEIVRGLNDGDKVLGR